MSDVTGYGREHERWGGRAADDGDVPAEAELRVPARSAYVGVLRMTAAGLAARTEFTLEDIEDLRMAIGEACALLLDCGPGRTMIARFHLDPRAMTISVEVDAAGEPDRDSFGWQVLGAVAHRVTAASSEGDRSIRFTIIGETS